MKPASRWTWRSWVLAVSIVAAPVALGALYLSGAIRQVGRFAFPLDDPYIHLQYARNLATGHGFSFNPDEPSPGATSPAWVVLLALGRLVAGSSEVAAVVLGMASVALAGLLTRSLALRLGLSPVLAAAAGVVVVLTGRVTWASVSGMETALALAAATLVLRLHYSALTGTRRGLALGAAAGIAATIRPELLALAALVGVAELLRTIHESRSARAAPRTPRGRSRTSARRHPSLAVVPIYAAAVLALVLPYTLFCLHTTGRPFPNTFYAKSLIPLAAGWVTLPVQRAHYLPEMAKLLWLDDPLVLLALVPGAVWAWRERRLVLLLWPLCFWLYAMILMPVLYHHARYTIPLTSSLVVLAIGGIVLLGRRPWVSAVGAAALVAGILPGQLSLYKAYVSDVDTTASMHVAMGEWIRSNVPPGASVATHDVGAVTYYGERRCVDMIGLVSSDLITRIRETDIKRVDPMTTLWAFLRDQHPDYYVLFPQSYPELATHPNLRSAHRIEHTNTTGGDDVFVAYRVVP